jgi:MoaA/NifB/PqqE/SkfB family radical SAM enzyme
MNSSPSLVDLLGKVAEIAQSTGLSESQFEKAIERIAGGLSQLDSGEAKSEESSHSHLLEGLQKNINDDPMLVAWAIRLASELGEEAWKKFFENFIVRAVVDRRTIRKRMTEELGHAPPVTLVVNPTMNCNLRCRGCYSFEYSRDGMMDPALMRKVLREARDMGIRFITLSGGEPFAYKHLFDIVEEFHDLTFMSYTNGTLIDEKAADRLARAGNLIPAFSVEGYREETEARRGPGVYDRILAAMERLNSRGVLFGISLTLTRLNSDLVTKDELLDFYLGLGARFAWLFTYIPVGMAPELDLMPTPQQRDILRQSVVRWRKTRPVFLGDFWNDGATCGGCLSASKYAYVSAEGFVQPCTFVHFYTHSIREHSLREIFQSPFFRAIRQAQPYGTNLLRACKVIDHPAVLRRLVVDCDAKPAYPGAEAIINNPQFVSRIEKYAEEYKAIADKAWSGEDYHDGHAALVPFSGIVDLYKRFPARMQNALKFDETLDKKPK